MHLLIGKKDAQAECKVSFVEEKSVIYNIKWYKSILLWRYMNFIRWTGKLHDVWACRAWNYKRLFQWWTHLSSTSEPSVRHLTLSKDFYFGISYSKMCKYSHITLLEYEGKKHVALGETWNMSRWWNSWCHKILVHLKVSLQTTGNKRHQFTTIYF